MTNPAKITRGKKIDHHSGHHQIRRMGRDGFEAFFSHADLNLRRANPVSQLFRTRLVCHGDAGRAEASHLARELPDIAPSSESHHLEVLGLNYALRASDEAGDFSDGTLLAMEFGADGSTWAVTIDRGGRLDGE